MTIKELKVYHQGLKDWDKRGGCLPTPLQELLLKAAILPLPSAWEAWQKWREQVDLETEYIDLGSFRILPLVYHNLKNNLTNDPYLGILQGLQRRTWYINEMQFRNCQKVLDALQKAGIETMVLKGIPLALNYYPHSGLRPMGDFDILVHKNTIHQAIKIVADKGWRPLDLTPAHFSKAYLSMWHAHPFENGQDSHLDLHWHLLFDCLAEDVDQIFWDGSVCTEVKGTKTRSLNPTDLLLHSLVHSVEWAPIPPMRWVADVYYILAIAGAQIDWARLVAQTKRCHVSLKVITGLHYLREVFELPIPSSVLEDLKSIPVSVPEERLFKSVTQKSRFLGGFWAIWCRYQIYAERADYGNFLLRAVKFPDYLRIFLGQDSIYDVGAWFVSKANGRIQSQLKSLGRLTK